MVVNRVRKLRKRRGGSTGYGCHKKHRGAGSRGGRGLAGLHKHKVMRMIKYMPDHFGKVGFKRPQKVNRVAEIKAINLNDLDSRIEVLLRDKKVKEDSEGVKINLSDLGYDKLLGSGQIKHKMIIEAKGFSKNAVKKLEEIGGKAITVK